MPALADHYLGGYSHIVPDNFPTITEMFTHAFVTYAVECFVEHAHSTQPVYHYMYSHLVRTTILQTEMTKNYD